MNWISVKDRMPEENTRVLLFIEYEENVEPKSYNPPVYEKRGLMEVGSWEFHFTSEGMEVLWNISPCCIMDFEVIYWMPLPDKPSEEKAGR